MLTIEQIKECAGNIAKEYPIKSIELFGSYAENRQTEDSDIDLLVEFVASSVSLVTLASIKQVFEDKLSVPVDIIHAPIPKDSLITIGKVLPIYEQ